MNSAAKIVRRTTGLQVRRILLAAGAIKQAFGNTFYRRNNGKAIEYADLRSGWNEKLWAPFTLADALAGADVQ
jgi:hypothetical protein